MDWAFWTGTTVFVVTIGGLLWLRDRPVTDRTRVVDRDGRRVRVVELRVRRIVATLRATSNLPHTGPLLRGKLRMSRRTFYSAVEYMRSRGLLETVALTDEPFLGYRLTRRGMERPS